MEENNMSGFDDAEMEDCDGQKVVTMMDVLKEQEDFENNANAVLGASDEKNCTYPKGYIKRQAIYACMTCCSEAKDEPSKRAGVCLACSLVCHENHELIELYTKRSFRCDCGNPKFNSNPCQYTPTKTDLNEGNDYNQNFSGLYCVCRRPYPDPESTVEDEMIQCIICEDWLHASHLEATVPSNDQYSEMICKGCMEKNHFLHDYSNLAVNVENENIDVVVDSLEVNMNGNNLNNMVSDVKENPDKCEDLAPNNGDKQSFANSSLKSDLLQESGSNSTSQAKDKENSVSDSNVKKQELNVDSTIQNTENDNECMEEDKLLADPENNPEKQDCKVDPSEPEVVKGHELNKEQDQESSTIVQTNEVKASETNEKINNAHIETTQNDNISNELSPVNNIDENENNENSTKSNSEGELDKTPDKTAEVTDISNSEIRNIDAESKQLPTNSMESITEKTNDDPNHTSNDNQKNVTNETTSETMNTNKDTNKSEETSSEYKRKLSIEESIIEDSTTAGKRLKVDSCCIRPKNIRKIYKGATFWPSDFRHKLCTCNECLAMYKDLSVLFLTDFDDTVTAYENLGEEKERIEGRPASQYEKGLQALSSLDRVQQINALTEYNKMKDKLIDFLKTFKDRKEVVKEEDIKEFFAGMKPKREPDGVYFCR